MGMTLFWQDKYLNFLNEQAMVKIVGKIQNQCYIKTPVQQNQTCTRPEVFVKSYLLFLTCFYLTNFFGEEKLKLLKVSKTQKQIVKSWILPKKEWTNLTLLLWYLRSTCVCSFLGRNQRHKKKPFRNWHAFLFISKLIKICLSWIIFSFESMQEWSFF